MLSKLKGWRTYLSIAAAALVVINDAIQAIPLDSGVENAIIGAFLAAAAIFRSLATSGK